MTTTTTAPATPDHYARVIVDLVRRHNGGVSFVEIARALERAGMDPVRGDVALDIGHNIIVWAGMSAGYFDAVRDALRSGEVHMTPTPLLVYLADGEHLRLPLAKRPPAAGYREPHWAPVCFQPGPPETPKGKKPTTD